MHLVVQSLQLLVYNISCSQSRQFVLQVWDVNPVIAVFVSFSLQGTVRTYRSC